MPTATPFTALGAGNGLPFCCIPIDIINNPPDPSNDIYRLYELCPETFTLEEVMNWLWNVSDYISTAISYGRYRLSDDELLIAYTLYLNYSEAAEAYSGGGSLADFGQGLALYPIGSARNIEPHERVCASYVRFRFTVLNSNNALYFSERIFVRIVYDKINDNYRFLVRLPNNIMGTEKYVEDAWSSGTGNTTTLSIPITTSKNISIPMATRPPATGGSSEYRFISTTSGSLVSYTYS